MNQATAACRTAAMDRAMVVWAAAVAVAAMTRVMVAWAAAVAAMTRVMVELGGYGQSFFNINYARSKPPPPSVTREERLQATDARVHFYSGEGGAQPPPRGYGGGYPYPPPQSSSSYNQYGYGGYYGGGGGGGAPPPMDMPSIPPVRHPRHHLLHRHREGVYLGTS
ncbi:hypothetical protein EJB05_43801, partial [Eragrostis curvula]